MIKSVNMPHTIDSPEFQLLLSCCKILPVDYILKSRTAVLNNPINEELFKSLVIRHRIAPIVYLNLKDEPQITESLKEWLKNKTRENQVASLRSLQMMVTIQQELSKQRAHGIFLKGVALAQMYYGDASLRESIDIDLWLEESAVAPISSWLHSFGYSSKLHLEDMNRRQLAYLKKSDYHHSFFSTQANIPPEIELHWKLRSGSYVLNHELSAQKIQLQQWVAGNIEISVFNHIDQFLYLCVHGTEHAWFRLKWLYDLPQMISKVEFNWAVVRERAVNLSCLSHLELSFLVLNKFLKIEIPSEISTKMQPEKYSNQLNYITKAILTEKGINENDGNRVRHFFFIWSLAKTKYKLSILLKYFTGPGDWKFLPLPEYLFILYFPLRPFLWLARRISPH